MLHAMCLHTPPQPVQKSFQLFQFLCRKAGSRSRLCLPENLCHCRCRLLPYRAVGVEHGLLLAVRLDGARVGGREWKGLLLALSPTPVTDGGGYSALIGA